MSGQTIKTIGPLIANWGLNPEATIPVRDVYWILTEKGNYCFKEVKEEVGKLEFMSQVFRHLEANGFHRMAAFLPTLKGESYVEENGNYYYVTPWLEGKEPDYLNLEQMGECARTLAEFHLFSQGFEPHGDAELKPKLMKWDKKLKKQLIEVVDYCCRAENSKDPGGFDQIIRLHGPWLRQQALTAYKLLESSPYDELILQYAGKVPVCHGDTATRNFILDRQNQAWMIDFDSMAVDLPIVDLWRLLRRTLRKCGWEIQKATNILDRYNLVKPVTKQELQVLFALLHFPERPWRMAKRYYEGINSVKENSKLQKRVEEYLVPWEKKNSFLEQFAANYAL